MQTRKLVGVLLCGFGALLFFSAVPFLVFEKNYETSAQRLFPLWTLILAVCVGAILAIVGALLIALQKE
jgi:H+/Cl- antiporter ClcA